MKMYIIILVVGIIIGIMATLIAQRCDVEEVMKPLYYIIGELGVQCSK